MVSTVPDDVPCNLTRSLADVIGGTGGRTGSLPESHEECEGEQQSSQRDTVTQIVDDDGNLIVNFTLPLSRQTDRQTERKDSCQFNQT